MVSGLLLILAAPVSVWRLTGEVLDELPDTPGIEYRDTRHRVGALSDPMFVVARRTWTDTSEAEIRQALLDGGFETSSIGLAKPCCGDADAVVVLELIEGPEVGRVEVRLTTADVDIQGAVVIFALLGLALAVPGLGLVVTSWDSLRASRADRRHPTRV